MQVLWAVDLAGNFPDGGPTSIASMAHVPELEAVFVAMHAGELFLIHLETQDVEEVCFDMRKLLSGPLFA